MTAPRSSLQGRPRGSGRPVGVPPVTLSLSEAPPFLAGLRVGRAYPHVIWSYKGDLEDASPYMTTGERRALAAGDVDAWAKWVGLGLMYAGFEHTMRVARGG